MARKLPHIRTDEWRKNIRTEFIQGTPLTDIAYKYAITVGEVRKVCKGWEQFRKEEEEAE